MPQPSTRAVQALDRLGIDWRADRAEREDHDPPASRPENDDRPSVPLPHDWPRTDAELLEALDDLNRLDAAQNAMYAPGSHREGDSVPGYGALEDARAGALDRLAEIRAESLIGLQVKARALLTRSVADISGGGDDIARSLARDLLGARHRSIKPRPDPILAALAELERREAACAAEWKRDRSDNGGPVRNAAQTAVFEHWRGVVLKTVPTTARGCTALARFARAFHERWAASLDQDGSTVLALIARSPLL